MKVTVREGKRRAGRFSVSVPAGQIAMLESALSYLVNHGGASVSQVVINLVIDAARRAGWKPDTPTNPQHH